MTSAVQKTSKITRLYQLVHEHCAEPVAKDDFCRFFAPYSDNSIDQTSYTARRFVDWCKRHGRSAFPVRPETQLRYLKDWNENGGRYPGIRTANSDFRRIQRALGIDDGREDGLRGGYVKAFIRQLRREHSPIRELALVYADERSAPSGSALLLDDVLQACRPTVRGMRDAAMIALVFDCALRSGELHNTDLSQFLRGDGKYRFALSESVTKDLEPSTGERIDAWLRVSGIESGPLFRGLKRIRKTRHAPIVDTNTQCLKLLPSPMSFLNTSAALNAVVTRALRRKFPELDADQIGVLRKSYQMRSLRLGSIVSRLPDVRLIDTILADLRLRNVNSLDCLRG